MKRKSVKFRITLWYVLIMLLMTMVALSVMTSASQKIINNDAKKKIVRVVDTFSKRLIRPDGQFREIPHFGFYEEGVHMMLYNESGKLIGGNVPFEIKDNTEFQNKLLNYYTEGEYKYFIHMKEVRLLNGESLWIKGIISITDESFAVQSAKKTNMIMAICFIMFAAMGGYLIINKALKPVNKINNTVKEICKNGDLSKRINLEDGNDEIYSLAATFDDMLSKLQETFEREKQFTSDASHELRTPVAVILSECEYMSDCAKTEEDFCESAAAIQRQAEKMSKLISELLTISRMDKNTLKTEFERLDLSELLGFVCDEQEEIHDSSIKLRRSIEDNITVNADRLLITRLFINLISNAYTYSKATGTITVELFEKENNVHFSVKDEGVGIKKENIDKIWERFYQEEPARSSKENGSVGLGLSMVKWIARVHDAEIRVESEYGKGSKFILDIPRK